MEYIILKNNDDSWVINKQTIINKYHVLGIVEADFDLIVVIAHLNTALWHLFSSRTCAVTMYLDWITMWSFQAAKIMINLSKVLWIIR